jgi:hypothetical protein
MHCSSSFLRHDGTRQILPTAAPGEQAMILQQAEEREFADLEQKIKHRIEQRTNGRIKSLRVAADSESVEIRGRAASYYLKQLAIQSILDVIGQCATKRINPNIEVDQIKS